MKRAIAVIFLVLIIAVPVFAAEEFSLTKGQIDLLNNLQKQGLLSIEPNLNKAYVNSSLWQNMKYSLKEDFAATLAIYCAQKKGSNSYWVKIYDQYSGKKLARYSQGWGFKIYK